MVELSIPVIWVEQGGTPVAGRLDVTSSGLHLDGGSRTTRRTRDLDYDDIASVRVGRHNGERIGGRNAVVLELIGGSTLSFSGFDQPGAVNELAERLERALSS
jgi:hypothetical protein